MTQRTDQSQQRGRSLRKGIVLAGGAGTRLHPITAAISKQLLPVYNKPMIYYPLSALMLAGIREILVISTPRDLPLFERLLGDGSQWGVAFSYAEQPVPRGLAEAFLIGDAFLGGAPVCLALGDNLLYGSSVGPLLREANAQDVGATIFGYPVKIPQRYGVIECDEQGQPLSIEEKPAVPKSRYAVPGIYFYDADVTDLAREVRPSDRGELEITAINQMYLERNRLTVHLLGRGVAWFDTGTHESLLQASTYVEAIELRQGMMIACLEEIALSNGWIDVEAVAEQAASLESGTYAEYLNQLVAEKRRARRLPSVG